jgi:hypothetical protein
VNANRFYGQSRVSLREMNLATLSPDIRTEAARLRDEPLDRVAERAAIIYESEILSWDEACVRALAEEKNAADKAATRDEPNQGVST